MCFIYIYICYTCICVCIVTVFNEFVITPSGDPINIVEGTTTDVTCDIVGNTRFNAMLFDPSGTLLAQRLNNANGVTYTLNNPQRSASGVYRCEANIAAANAGGLLRMMETNITINIQCKPLLCAGSLPVVTDRVPQILLRMSCWTPLKLSRTRE